MQRAILLKNLKILLDTDLKIILLNHQNNFAGILSIMLQTYFDILAINFFVLSNYFYGPTKLFFRSVSS